MSSLLEKNVLCMNQQNIMSKEEEAKFLDIKTEEGVFENKKGEVYFKGIQHDYQLISREMKNEAAYLEKNIEWEKDNLLLIFGLGNIEFLKQLLEKASKDTRIALFEPNSYVLKYMLSNYDFSFLLEDSRVSMFYECELNQSLERRITERCEGNWEQLVHNISVISLPNYYIYHDFMLSVVKHIKVVIDSYIMAGGNSLYDEFHGLYNNVLNVDNFLECNSINEVIGKFKGYPAIIVAAGPSLDKNITYLKNAKDKALILACDASYDACVENGVEPDGIASIERVRTTYNFYYKGKKRNKDTVLLAPGLLHPSIYEEIPGKKIIMGKVNQGVEEWWNRHFENVEFIPMGSSCAHVAFSVAVYAGCNPIMLIGQDLAFTGEKLHSELAHTEYEGANDSSRADGTIVEDVYGNPVRTNRVFDQFRFWFEKQIRFNPKLKVIDATEGGAKIAGTEIMSLSEAINRYCNKKLAYHLNDCLAENKISHQEYIAKYKELIEDGEKQILILKDIQEKAERYYEKLVKYYEKDYEILSIECLEEIVRNLKEGLDIIEYIKTQEEVYSFYKQIIMQMNIYTKKEGNEIVGKVVKRKIQLQANVFGMIKRSTGLIIEEYEQLVEIMTDKMKSRGEVEWKEYKN